MWVTVVCLDVKGICWWWLPVTIVRVSIRGASKRVGVNTSTRDSRGNDEGQQCRLVLVGIVNV